MALALAALPDARVGLAPLLGGAIGKPAEKAGGERVELAEVVADRPGAVEHVAEHVELLLAPRGVADTHRPRPEVPVEMVEAMLGQVALALDAEDDLDLVLGATGHGAAHHPVEVAQRLARARRRSTTLGS